ncbi:glycosyltransferase family 34 protein [Dothidotthia symphoricarpi CBS 119687]|uniref:Glycosyltransferase family 34 protein n=1 Tax=Dothidotthia symphoricarpi CBS 119687 TaxID=1392245 RepID=A0A6A6APJ5_9PLEO|nr:glycosyltransferase family 34 protein [Dothidotthia symphoricarpi CBS 119687]KAF2132807.1 glycosyltransferase family 34 protein [Dothidotthia symphoricarpi CBS 119687]
MLFRSMRSLPSALVLVLVFLGFFGWQLSQGHSHEPLPPPPAQDESPPPEAQKKPLRVALMTFVTEQRSYLHVSLKNKDHYARRHGHDLIVDYEAHSDRGVMWWKYTMAERAVKSGKYDWIWWLDFDTLITNTATKITDIIEEELNNATNLDAIDFLLTKDCNGLNAGSFLLRGHERSIKFFDDARTMFDKAKKEETNMSEQDCMSKLLKEDQATSDMAHFVPQWKLNAFPEEIACYDESKKGWEQGTFVLHFAGAWAHVKGDDPTGQLMKKYEHDIIWGDAKEFY